MYKITKLLALLTITLFFISCSKTPFKELKSSKDLSLVYVYAKDSNEHDAVIFNPCYTLSINTNMIDGCIAIDEYMEFNDLKPNKIEISAIRSDIEKKSIKIDLEKGGIYYLKIDTFSSSFNDFEFRLVDEVTALGEIKKMGLANPSKKEDTFLKVFETNKENGIIKVKTDKELSKSDEIRKAHALKKDGLITEEEYKKLKYRILSK